MKRISPEKAIWLYRIFFVSVILAESLLILLAFRFFNAAGWLGYLVSGIYFLIAVRPALSDIRIAGMIERKNPQLGENLISYIELMKTRLDYGREFVELLRELAEKDLTVKNVVRAVTIEPWGVRIAYSLVILKLIALLLYRPMPYMAVFPKEIRTFEDSLIVVHSFGCTRCKLLVNSDEIKPASVKPSGEAIFVLKLKRHGDYVGKFVYRDTPMDSIRIKVYPRPIVSAVEAEVLRQGRRFRIKNPSYIPVRQGGTIKFDVRVANADSTWVMWRGRKFKTFSDTAFAFALRADTSDVINFILFEDGLKEKSIRQIAIDIVKDEPPFVALLFPPSVYDLPDDQKVPVRGYAEDDFGLKSISAAYVFGGDTVTMLKQLSNYAYSDSLSGVIDLSHLGLLPGDEVEIMACATDIAGHRVCSAPSTIRFPTLDEIYRRTTENVTRSHQSVRELNTSVDSMYRAFQKLEEQLRSNRSLTWSERQKIEEAIQQGKKRLQELQEKMKSLKNTLQKLSSLSIDPELSHRLQEISNMLEQLMPEMLNRQLQQLQDALNRNNLNDVTNLMNQLQENQKEFLKKLEAMEKLLKRALEENKLKEFIERAKSIATEQEELERLTKTASPENIDSLISLQKDLQEKAQQLQQDMKSLAAEASDSSITEELNRLDSQYMQSVLSDMDKAANRMNQMQTKSATKAQESAKVSLNKMADELKSFRDKLINQRKQQIIEKLGYLISEGLAISSEQAAILASEEDPLRLAEREAAVQRGMASFSGEVFQIASESMFLMPNDIALFGQASNYAAKAMEKYSVGNRFTGDKFARSALAYLNRGIRRLLEAQQMAKKSQSSSNMEQLMQQLAEAMNKQQQLAAGTQSLLPMPVPMTSGIQQMLQQLAQEQMQLAQQLQELARKIGNQMAQGQVQSAADEAEKIAKDLSAGNVNQDIVRRQRDVAQKLLDAQRALKEREFSPRRKSKAGKFVPPSKKPAQIEELQERQRIKNAMLRSKNYPSEYRKLIEAYYKTLLKH